MSTVCLETSTVWAALASGPQRTTWTPAGLEWPLQEMPCFAREEEEEEEEIEDDDDEELEEDLDEDDDDDDDDWEEEE